VRATHLDVPWPPLDLRPDHVRAGPDEAEGEQEGDEEEEVRLTPGVDDPVLVRARDAPHPQHGRNASDRR
jgi:hypothetical protein